MSKDKKEIKFLVSSVFETKYSEKKYMKMFDNDKLEIHYSFKDNTDLSSEINKNDIVDKITNTLMNDEFIKNVNRIYVFSTNNKIELLSINVKQ